MAKKKRTGLDALREYEAGSTNAASSAASYGQTQTQTKSSAIKRSGLDAIREYEQYGNPGAVQDTAFDPNYRSRNYQTSEMKAAFEAYKNAVNAAKKIPNSAIGGKVSQQEYSRSPAMQAEYGTYENYLRGVTAAQGRKLGTQALRQQSALLAGQFAPATQKTREDVNALNRRTRAAQNAQRDQVRGMRRTSQELGKQIEALEEEQADAHFAADGRSASGKSPTQLQDEINALQDRKNLVDSQSVLERARDAMSGLSEEEQNLLRQYRGQELNGYQVRAYAKYDAKKALNEKGYSDDTLKRLAEWQKVLDDYDNAQKIDQAAQEMGSGSFAGKAAATLFSAALAPGKALGNVESLRGVLPSWAGGYQNEDMPTNIYSPAYNASRLSSGIRQSVMQNMNPTGQFLYQAGTSALDSAVNMAVSTGLVGTVGGAAGAGAKDAIAETMNWVMGSQVAADSVYEGIQNGKSNADALVDGIVEGAIEGITEKYSVGDIIENMLSGKAVWRKALRSFASEGAEEIASNWLNRAYDVVAKHDRGEVMTAYANYIAEGKTPAQALAAMVGDFAKEDSLSFLAGGLSGLAMSGTYAGVNRVILEANVTQTARAVIAAGEVQDVIDYGMAQEEGTKAYQLAEELQQTVDEGSEVTQKAVEDTLREVAREQQAAVDEGEEPRVPEKLTRLEQLQQEAAQEQLKADTQERTYQIYKDAVQSAQEATRAAQEYARAEQEQRKQQEAGATAQQRSGEMRAAQRAQRAAEQAQYDQGSLLSQIPGTEEIGELDPEQYARQQTADAEQALDEAALQQEEQYLQTKAQRAGYDEQTAAYFLNGNTTGLPAEQYAASFERVYEQGRLGASEQRAMRYAEGMNQDVAAAAYRAGLAAGQKGVNNGSIETTDEGQVGQAGQRAEGQAGGVRKSTAQQQRADAGRKRAQGARDLAKAWDEVELSTLGFGKDNTQKVRVMPKGQEARSEDIQAAEKFFRSMGVQNARFFTGQLTQEIDGQTFYADAAVTEDGSVLIRADSEEYSAFELAKHEGYHLLVNRWPEMAAKIQKRLLGEGKITKEMIESYVDAYAGIYGDDTDAYVEEIVADTYAGMNRTDFGTNQLRTDVKMEVGQWQKKSGSARAPPAGNKWSAGYDPETASIKDQLRNSIDELNKMNVVASIQTPTKFTSKSAAAKWAIDLLAKFGGKVDRQGYGEIYFSPKDINKAVDYADTNEEKAAVAAVPMVLKRGKEIGGHQNHKGREKQTITFAAPVALNGQRGNMAVVVNKNGNHYYTHRIVTPDGRTFVFNKEDAAQEPSRGVTVSGSLADTTSAASKASISKTGETVKGKFSASARQETKMSDETDAAGTKLSERQAKFFADSQVRTEDADQKLLPVYHSTYGEFTVFNRRKLGENALGNAADASLAATALIGHWFSDHDASAKIGGKAEKYYLNIKNPYETSLDWLADEIGEYAGDYADVQEAYEYGEYGQTRQMARGFVNFLRRNGYDGLIVSDRELGGTSYVALDANQIKRTDNLSPTKKNDIRFSASARQASERDKQNLETVSAMLDDGSGRGVFKDAVFLRNPRLMQKLIDEREKTQTAAFRDWFADSKATNTTGEPLLVFHGAGAKFTKFDVGGKPIWLTANIKYAEEYSTATRSVERILPEASIYAGNVDRIIPAYIRVENPADVGNTDGGYSGNYVNLAKRLQIRPSELQAVWEQAGKPELMWQVINTPGMVEMLKRHGYDGVQAVENGVKAWAVFDSAQVKSAVANNGSFSLTNPDIRYSSQDGRYRDLMGEKAAQYVRRLESRMVNELAENLSVPGQAKREILRPMAEEALRSFFTDGQLDRAKLNDLFETAYQAGIEEDTQYIEQYGDLKKFIRDQRISISEKDRQDIADYNLFRKAAMGTLTISKDGLPVDVAYQQLQEMAPELFPADITAPSDQLMQIYDVARGIQKVQKTLDEYYGPQAASFKKWQQANFTESIDRLTSGLRVAQRYLDAQNKAKEKLAIPQTAEETKQMWTQLKDARRVVEKAQSKTLLTEADQKIVNRLLRGETSPDYVAGLENGQQILKVYEAKADYDMLALKLKAWNAQRKQGLREFAEQALTEAEAVKWVDKNMGIRYQRETMERNIRDIARKGKVSDEKANAFINKYFWPVHENESKRKNYLVEQQNRIRELKLDRQVRKGNLVSESYAVQWLGEAEFNRDYLKQHPRVERRGGMTFDEWNAAIQDFEKQNPDLDLGKVREAVKVFHEVYDKLFQDMNRVRIENGYEPVNYLQGYFPHFQENEEGGSILQKFARAAGIEGDVSPLPATINGLTANFKPGIRYMANIQNRLGYATAYDALQGFDRYIEVATDVIFHTADIQRLRALATQIRYRASDEGLKQRIDAIMMNPFLNPDEANEQVTNLTKEGRYGLSNFVDELDEYTNLLAGKKSRLDRGMEKLMGRRFYNVMKKFESRVGANMVAANVGSALTNFIPITQAWSQVSTVDVLRGMWDTLKNYKTADGLDSASMFINNRSGYGRLAMSTMDKVSEKAGILMEVVDRFTTGSVVRARYYQNLQRGMSEISAMQEADQFAAGVMADRSKGSTPTLYSARNPLVKLFTQFQLEVNNELSWIFKDMAQEERKKGVAALAKAMFKFLIGAWIYNEFYESIVGRRPALDPLDIINDTVGDFTGYQLPNTVQAAVSGKWDFTKEKPGTYQAIKNLEGNIISEFPGTQALTILGVDEALGLDIDSGRIAVASAIPNLGNIEKALLAKNEDMDPAKKAKTITDELIKPGLYLATPFGGGQARKLIQGGVAAWKGGSYSVDNEGRDILQYPVYNDNAADRAKSWAQALLFGKTATEEAQSWVESGFKSLSAKETAAYQGMTEGGEDQRETYAFIQAARKLEKNYDKMMLLKAYDISDAAKAEYYYQVLAGDTQKAEMEPKSTQERIDYMNEKIQDAQEARQKQDLKDAVAAGTVTQEKAIQKILANDYAEDEDKAYWLYKEWTGGKDYTKYGKILQTIEYGGDLKAAAKEYFDHGAKKGDIGDAITTEYKPKYIAASPEERKKLKEKLLAAYTAVGFDRSKKSKDIDKWLKDSK
nr:MAG TPA: PolyVal ADP-Ribosyltransferase [Caudoviricetes sp.]